MNNYHFGGGVRRSFMTFGGVVPEIKRLDYEIPYVDPARIYGFGSNANNHQKNNFTVIKKNEKNHILGGGDCGTISAKESTKEVETSRIEKSIVPTISQKSLELNVSNIMNDGNKYGKLPNINQNTSINSIRDKNLSLLSTQINASSFHESLDPIKLKELQKFSTPITLPEKQVEEHSKQIVKRTPRLMNTWKSYRTNIHRQIKRPKLPGSLKMPNIFRNQARIKNNVAIKNYPDKEKEKQLVMTTNVPCLIVDEPVKLGVINSLKEEFEMYRKCYKIQKEVPSIKEEVNKDIVHNLQERKETKMVVLFKKVYSYVTKCLYFDKP
uniref:Enkurin domain-containing protein n=1 Tax=Strongyloides papillosus TaxID=174720 RepID=A0A0N5BD73_STREA